MTIGDRIRERLGVVGISQSELARRAGLTQGTIGGLVIGKARSSAHLHKIARELRTSVGYLTGETDDPDENAPPPPPLQAVHHVMMAVALPPERALARMFEGLLRTIDPAAPVAEQALLLAQRLPIGLSQLRDLLPETVPPTAAQGPGAGPEVLATLAAELR